LQSSQESSGEGTRRVACWTLLAINVCSLVFACSLDGNHRLDGNHLDGKLQAQVGLLLEYSIVAFPVVPVSRSKRCIQPFR